MPSTVSPIRLRSCASTNSTSIHPPFSSPHQPIGPHTLTGAFDSLAPHRMHTQVCRGVISDRVFFRISGPAGYSLTTSTDGSEAWTYDWDFSSLESGEYTFEIWASDSNYCRDDSMGCEDRIVRRTLTIDTTNRAPNLQFTGLESDIENPVRVSQF